MASAIQGRRRIKICLVGSGAVLCGVLSLWTWRSGASSSPLRLYPEGDLIEYVKLETRRRHWIRGGQSVATASGYGRASTSPRPSPVRQQYD